MSSQKDPLAPNPETHRSPVHHASFEVLWAGLGDLVHESDGSWNDTLDYFHIGAETTSQPGQVKGDRMQQDTEAMIACWLTPETSNGMTLGVNRNFALRLVSRFTHRGGPVGDVLTQGKVTTELLVGRWAAVCAVLAEGSKIAEEVQLPSIKSIFSFVDLNTVLAHTKRTFDDKVQSRQDFRDAARSLQDIDLTSMLMRADVGRFGDLIHEGEPVSALASRIRGAANNVNNKRLTLQRDKPIWRLVENIDKA